jgi:hypothetical protein
MTQAPDPKLLHAERQARTRAHAADCVLLAVVTSTDVAAALIDQAVELHALLDHRPERASHAL